MLEVKNLKKIYKSKGGATVNALDGVTLRFPEKGMVFLLGKSGSGKSTLLNVCGGLDSPTEGEIIVKGRSSKDFTQSDFDSYRNTYVGFVFQEYNILNEFTVEDNISLALELQGKAKDKEAIAKLLSDVDLSEYGKRKPNTLSGGQKQRIAIARALIKNPEIIMADEPTGALDSKTGKQVFDTLKKLSLDKLVIVVSHDREFAEYYGDRIIELKDGKILSDVSKEAEAAESVSRGVSVVGEDIICIKDGEELEDSDFKFIKSFLSGKKNAIICRGDSDVTAVKKAVKINDDGSKEKFAKTDEEKLPKKTYSADDGKFIRSKLPIRHAFKLGASGLKSKPIRLVFTSLLCTVAFVLFGLLSTMMLYNSEAVFNESMSASSYSFIKLEKSYKSHYKSYEYGVLAYEHDQTASTAFTPAELLSYAEEFGDSAFGAMTGMRMAIENTNSRASNRYYTNFFSTVAAIGAGNSLNEKINGSYPAKDNEICISSFIAESLVFLGLDDPKTDEKYSDISTPQDLIGKQIYISQMGVYTITGIIDSGSIPQKYDVLKDNTYSGDYRLPYDFENELSSGIHCIAFVTEKTFENYASMFSLGSHYDRNSLSLRIITASDDEGNEIFSYNQAKPYASNKNDTYFFDSSKSELAAGEVTLGVYALREALFTTINNLPQDQFALFNDKSGDELSYSEKLSAGIDGKYYIYTASVEGEEQKEPEEKTLTREERIAYISEALIKLRSITGKDITLSIVARDEYNGEDIAETKKDVKLVGFSLSSDNEWVATIPDSQYNEIHGVVKEILMSGPHYYEETSNYVVPADAKYGCIFVPYDQSQNANNKLLSIKNSTYAADDSLVEINNPLIYQLDTTDAMVESLSQVFLYVGLVMAVFAALLLSNFISVSISSKTREIGILRAVGARSADVFKIFFSESLIITLICIVLSVIGGTVVCSFINASVSDMMGGINLFVFGPLSILMLIGVAALTAVAATYIPVYRAARRKPVDSIRSL